MSTQRVVAAPPRRTLRATVLSQLPLLAALHACGPEPAPAPPSGDAPSAALPAAPPTAPALTKPDLTHVAEEPLRAAIEAAWERVVREPQLLAAWVDYGTLLATHDWRVDAAAAFERAEALEQKEFRWPYLQGVLLATRDVEKALHAVERALRLDDGYAPAHVSRGKLLRDLSRYADARACFEKAAALDARNLDAWLALGQLSLEERAPEAAETALRKALALQPKHPEVNSALAAACFALKRKEEAERFAKAARDNAAKLAPDDPRAALSAPPITAGDYTDAAIARMQQGRIAEAEALLLQALALDRKSAVAWGNLARLQLARGDTTSAEQSLLEATALVPTVTTLRSLARLRHGRGQKSEAIDHLRAAAALDRDDVELARELGGWLLEASRFAEAADAFGAVLVARPLERDALAQLGKALRGLAAEQVRAARPAEAAATLRRALAAAPTQVDHERQLALLLATCPDDAVRDGAEALRLAQHASTGRTDEPEMLDALAAAQAETGDYDAAVATIRQALALVRAAKNRAGIDLYESRLQRYRAAKPLRLAPDGTALP